MPRSHVQLVRGSGLGRLAVLVLPVVLETSAQNEIALEGGAVLATGTPGVRVCISALRSKAELLHVALLSVTPEYCVLSFSFRPLRPTRAFGHFFLLLTTNIYIVA